MKNSKGFLVQADRDPAREEIVQHILQEMKEERIPGASICVVKEGRVVLVEGFGIANRETGDPVTSKTLFNIGSVSKSLTSLLLTMLADEGLLDLNTPIGHYVKELPPRLAGVTTAHLLSNTGGLIDFPTEFVEKKYDQNWPQTFMRIFKKDEEIIFWPPGEIFSYSSSGFVIAAAVAEIVSQKGFIQLMQEKVFTPAGMVDTTFIPPQEKAHRTSIGYGPVDEDGSFKRFSPEPEWFSLGAGAVFSTVEDMSGFAWFLMNEGKNPEGFQVFPKEVIASMQHPHILIQSNPHHLQYGFGLFITQINNGTLIAHEGATDGYTSLFRCVPETGFVWISLSNADFRDLQKTSDWALKHHGHMVPFPPTLPDSTHLPARSPNELCGKYFQGGNRADYFEISLSEDQLYIYHPEFCGHHPAVPLILVDGHRFEFTPPVLSSSISLVVVKEGIIDVTEIRYCKEGLPTSARRRGEHR